MSKKKSLPCHSDLKRHRWRAGLSQQQLADAIGVNRSSIQSWEHSVSPTTPTVATALHIIEVLRKPLGQILEVEDLFRLR